MKLFKEILKEIKKYDNIIIARHIGADPDALGSQFALKELIQYNFKGKTVHAVGSIASRFRFMGDLEKDFLEKVKDEIDWCEVDILFAPHHGRDSGKVPEDVLQKINPKIIVVGEAPSKNLNYYNDYNTVTQNSAKDIIFDCQSDYIHIYVSNESYAEKGVKFLEKLNNKKSSLGYYLGSLKL